MNDEPNKANATTQPQPLLRGVCYQGWRYGEGNLTKLRDDSQKVRYANHRLCNARQMAILRHELMGELRQRLDDGFTVAVVAPYTNELDRSREALERDLEGYARLWHVLNGHAPCLRASKEQATDQERLEGFDYCYYLPLADNTSAKRDLGWIEDTHLACKRLARRELCVIGNESFVRELDAEIVIERTRLLSIFDGGNSTHGLHTIGWSSAVERFATACARLESVRNSEVVLLAEQRISELLVHDGKTGQFQTLLECAACNKGSWNDLLSYIELKGVRAPRIDFVMVGARRWIKTGKNTYEPARPVLLAIEIDGTGHRCDDSMGAPHDDAQFIGSFTSDPKAARGLDRAKDRVCERLGARVQAGNGRTSRTTSGGHSFTLLRLRTDGSTAFETRELADHASTALQTSYVTIDELVDEALGRAEAPGRLVYVREPQACTHKADARVAAAASGGGALEARLPGQWGWWPTDEGLARGASAVLVMDSPCQVAHFVCVYPKSDTGMRAKDDI